MDVCAYEYDISVYTVTPSNQQKTDVALDKNSNTAYIARDRNSRHKSVSTYLLYVCI